MILVDAAVGSLELHTLIRRQGILCQKQHLDAADAAFEGFGPLGNTLVGVERKKVQEVLDCVETGRLGGFQLPKMRRMYGFRYVIIEGVWRPNTRTGALEREIVKADGRTYWTDIWAGNRREMYRKLRRYLVSLSFAGTQVIYTRDIGHTAFDICELYHWFQKAWHTHTSMNTLYTGDPWDRQAMHDEDLVMIPTISGRPSLVRQWASRLDGIGVKGSADVERTFKTARELADADETEWCNVPGVGLKKASNIVRQITGKK